MAQASNRSSADPIAVGCCTGLGHLSEHNNHPEIVRLIASQAIEGRRLNAQLIVLDPGKQSEAFVY